MGNRLYDVAVEETQVRKAAEGSSRESSSSVVSAQKPETAGSHSMKRLQDFLDQAGSLLHRTRQHRSSITSEPRIPSMSREHKEALKSVSPSFPPSASSEQSAKKATPFAAPQPPAEPTYGPANPFGPAATSELKSVETNNGSLPGSREQSVRRNVTFEHQNSFLRELQQYQPTIYRLQEHQGATHSEKALIECKNDVLKSWEDGEFHQTGKLLHLDDLLEKALQNNEVDEKYQEVFLFLLKMASAKIHKDEMFLDVLDTCQQLLRLYVRDSGVKTGGRNIPASIQDVELAKRFLTRLQSF